MAINRVPSLATLAIPLAAQRVNDFPDEENPITEFAIDNIQKYNEFQNVKNPLLEVAKKGDVDFLRFFYNRNPALINQRNSL